MHSLDVYSGQDLIQISILKFMLQVWKYNVHGHSTLLILNLFCYCPSHLLKTTIIMTANKVFTAFQSAHHFQEDDGDIKKKRSTIMFT